MYILFAYAMQIKQPTLALKFRGDATRNLKQPIRNTSPQWPQNRMCQCVRQKCFWNVIKILKMVPAQKKYHFQNITIMLIHPILYLW